MSRDISLSAVYNEGKADLAKELLLESKKKIGVLSISQRLLSFSLEKQTPYIVNYVFCKKLLRIYRYFIISEKCVVAPSFFFYY